MQALAQAQCTKVSAGIASMSSGPEGMRITITGSSTMTFNGLSMTAESLTIDGVVHPEVFSAEVCIHGSKKIFGTAIDGGSLYSIR